jgi:hypothetical protein
LLLGIFPYRLCTECRRDWGEFVEHAPQYAHVLALESRKLSLSGRAAAGDAPGEDEWRTLQEEALHVKAELRPVVGEWLEKRIKDFSEKVDA